MNKSFRETIGLFLYYISIVLGYPKSRFLSIYFHDPSPALFEKIVKWCVKKGYRFIDIDECYGLMTARENIKEKIAYISLDDGWRSNMELLPIIEKYNVPITIFVSVEPMKSGNFWWEYALKAYGREKMLEIKKYPYHQFLAEVETLKNNHTLERSAITEDDLKKLVRHPLVSIQSHAVTHPILTQCDDDTLEKELVESKSALEQFSGKEVYAFSYPNGDVSKRETGAIKDTGYYIAFTTEARNIDAAHDDLFLVPRMAMNTYGGFWENVAKITGIWQKVIG